MPDGLAAAIAVALVARAAELTADGVTGALRRLFRLIRDRFGAGTPEETTLAEAMQCPADGYRRAELAEALARVMAADADFADRVRAAWRDTAVERGRPDSQGERANRGERVSRGGVVNQFSGRAENVLQARDIGGDVRFGQ